MYFFTLHHIYIYIECLDRLLCFSTETLLCRCHSKRFHQDFALDDSDEEEPLELTPPEAAIQNKPAFRGSPRGLCKEGVLKNGEKGLVIYPYHPCKVII